MEMSICKEDLSKYIASQINVFFPDGNPLCAGFLNRYMGEIISRVEFCFSKINNRYFFDGKNVLFDHLNGDQYAMFLYFVSNTIFQLTNDVNFSAKIFNLNKLLHGIDAFYEVELPDVFLFVHPLGTVLGRGRYSNYFIVYQRCGVGSNKGFYPELKEHVTLRPGSSVLGKCLVEDNCTLASGSLLIDRNLEKNTVYIGNPKSFVMKKNDNLNNIWKV